jgi:GT2 family glycosyltransferase
MSEPVSIIILNCNGKHFLEKCINSILEQSYQKFEIIFFDNNSSDGSVEFVKKNFKNEKIKIIECDKNIGFAGGNNEAIKHASNDVIVLLNNDTETEKDWLKYLVEAIKEKNTIASSFVITEGINPKYYESNGSVSYCMYNIMNIFENKEDEFYPNGCSLIFRKSEIQEPFDSDYFFYSEDLYLGLKARFMGMKIKFVEDSIVNHFGGGAFSANNVRTFYQERNRFLNLYTFFSIGFILKLLPIIFIVKTARLFKSIFTTRLSFTGLIKAYFWFYFHIPAVFAKRRQLNKIKKINEKDVIKFISSNLLNSETQINRIINKISYIYSRFIGIKPIEYYQNRKLN